MIVKYITGPWFHDINLIKKQPVSAKSVQKNCRLLVLFYFEGKKMGTILEHKVGFQRNENMSIVKVQLCFLFYSMKTNQKDSRKYLTKQKFFFETGINNGQNLVNIVEKLHLSYICAKYIIFSFFSLFVESLFSSCTSIENLFCKRG